MAKKKKTAVLVLQAPKAVKRGKQKNSNRASNGGLRAPTHSRVSVSQSTILRPFHNIRSSKDGVTVSGMELLPPIIAPIGTTGVMSSNFYLNPANTQFFKRLSAVAMGYQKFRFRRLRLRYVTMCPTSIAGIVSAAILLDPLESVPQSVQEFLAYAHSLSTTVTLDATSAERKIVDPRWYFVDLGDLTGNSVDPTTRFQGNVSWMVSNTNSSSALQVGYLALEYECELTGHRPLRDSSLSLTATSGAQTFTGGSSAIVNTLNYSDITSCVGSFDVDADPKEPTLSVTGYTSGVTRNNSWSDMLFAHALEYFLPLGAAAVDGKAVEEEKGFIPRPPFSLSRSSSVAPYELSLAGRPVDMVPSWVSVFELSEDEKGVERSAVLAHPVRAKDLRIDHRYQLRGNAAGDVTVSLTSYLPGPSSTSIDSTVFSLGTGVLNLSKCVRWTPATALSRIALSIVPTGVETRVITNSNTTVADVALNGNRALG